jgi:hypothetical protein
VNKERIPKNVMNLKVKSKHPFIRPLSTWEQWVRKDVAQMEVRPWEETEEELWKDIWRCLIVR